MTGTPRRRGPLGAIRRRPASRGQGMVEFTLLVPLFLIMLLGMIELGFAFNHQLTLQYATREGARIGADLVDGTTGSCTPAIAATVDATIIEAVDRILTSTGSPIPLSQVSRIRIFKATSTGADSGLDNDWIYTATLVADVNGTPLNFKPGPTQTYSACNRSNQVGNTSPSVVDSLGISISYTYKLTTPLAGALKLIGGSQASSIAMTDDTVMQFNPTSN